MPIDIPPRRAERILLDGPDAVAFAHAQFSSNVATLLPGHWQFGAWLGPQGRVRALFHLVRTDDQRLLMVLRGGQAEPLAEALRRFVFRSRLRIDVLPAMSLTSAEPLPMHSSSTDAEGLILGCGDHALRLAEKPGDESWQWRQLENGWPWLPPVALDSHLPGELSLLRLGAAALDKGCYPGQEIVARLHYKGGQKRHLRKLRIAAIATAAPAGSPLMAHGRTVGRWLEAIGTDDGSLGLAVVDDEAELALHEGAVTTEQHIRVIADGEAWPA